MLVASVGQAVRLGMVELAWDLAISSVTLFECGAFFDDWRTTHQIALAATQRAEDRRGEAAMLYSLGALAVAEQRPRDALRFLTRARSAFESLNDRYGLALALRHRASAELTLGNLGAAAAGYTEAARLFDAADDPIAVAHALNNLAQIAIQRGHQSDAETALRRALEASRSTGSRRTTAQLNHRLGELELARGNPDRAGERFRDVLESVREHHDIVGEAYVRLGLGTVALTRRRVGDAEEHLLAGLRMSERVGDRMVRGRLLMALADSCRETGRPTAAAAALAEALTLFRALDAKRWQACVLDALGCLHADAGGQTDARTAWYAGLEALAALAAPDAADLVARLNARLEA
jgi:tetratricopeptide (TPR) repeat protein